MSKHKYLLFLFICAFLALPTVVCAVDESIKEFLVDVKVDQDSSLSVTETIVYDFGPNSKHGIFRDVPMYSIQNGKKDKITFKDISVVDENSQPYNFDQSKISGGIVRIKIGDADKFVSGVKTYKISYSVKGAVMFLDDRDEIYWNATGNGWKVPIGYSEAVVYLSKPLPEAAVRFDCYAGQAGSTDGCELKELQKDADGLVSAVKFSQSGLVAGSGLTAAVGLPVGTVDKPAWYERFFDFVAGNLALFAPFVVFAVCYSIWKKKGRDPKGAGTIITQFDAPDKLTPLEVGILADYKADDSELAAELIYLAIHGYIRIKQVSSTDQSFGQFDYELERIKKDGGGLADFQKTLLDGLFGSADKKITSELKYKFGPIWGDAMDKGHNGLIARKYFPQNPLRLRNVFYTVAGIFVFLLMVAIAFGGTEFLNVGAVEIVSAAISIAIIFIFGHLMTTRTESGQRAKEHIEGLKTYLTVAEKDRLNFHNAPEKKPEHFEALLPFAIVLGVEKKWAGQFDDIVMPEPDWYVRRQRGVFSASALVSDLRQFRSTGIANAVSAKPSERSGGLGGSSGGGSSGGGHGGGGGRSW